MTDIPLFETHDLADAFEHERAHSNDVAKDRDKKMTQESWLLGLVFSAAAAMVVFGDSVQQFISSLF